MPISLSEQELHSSLMTDLEPHQYELQGNYIFYQDF